MRQQIDTTLSLTQLSTTPEAYKDNILMLGGDILSTRNLSEGTLSKGCKNRRILRIDSLVWIGSKSASRRFVRDTSIYNKERQVILAGRDLGTRTDTVGEITYLYPYTGLLGGLSLAAHARYAYVVSLWVTGGYGTVHTWGSLIPSVVSDRRWPPIRTSGGRYMVALADHAREPTGLRGL